MSEQMKEKQTLFTKREVLEAWACLRKFNHSLSDECLDEMKTILLKSVSERIG